MAIAQMDGTTMAKRDAKVCLCLILVCLICFSCISAWSKCHKVQYHCLINTFKRFVCADVDECAKDNGGCHKDRKCTNTAGGMKCGDCPDGLVNAGDKGCTGSVCLDKNLSNFHT